MAGEIAAFEVIDIPQGGLETMVNLELAEFMVGLDEGVPYLDCCPTFIREELDVDSEETVAYVDASADLITITGNEGVRETAYRAFLFAHLVGSLVGEIPLGIPPPEFYASAHGPHDMRSRFSAAARDYFATSRTLEAVTDVNLDEIDPSGKHRILAKVFVGFTLHFIEIAAAELKMDQASERFMTELEQWDNSRAK